MQINKSYWAPLAALLIAGCGGPPQVSPANRRLIDGLRTATSSEQMPWIEECAEQLEEGKRDGTVSHQEYDEFQKIIHLAKARKWKEAEAAAIQLGKAQKPTAEEAEKAKSRQKPTQ